MRKLGITKDEIIRLANYIQQRSSEYNLSMDTEGRWYAGDSEERVSVKKLTKYLAEDVTANKVTKLKGRDLTKFIAIAIKGTKETLLQSDQNKPETQ